MQWFVAINDDGKKLTVAAPSQAASSLQLRHVVVDHQKAFDCMQGNCLSASAGCCFMMVHHTFGDLDS